MNRRRGGDQVIPRPASWRAGETPPWVDAITPQSFPTCAQLVERIAAHKQHGENNSVEFSQEWVASARSSAVLVPLVETSDGPSFVLTKRAVHLKNHSGEVSFPGGRVEEGESVHAAAVRESFEEIGLDPRHVAIVGELDALTTFVSNSVIVPVVARVSSIEDLQANAEEVSRIFVVPIIEFLRGDTYRNEWWLTPRGDINIHFFELDDETIWGATARIIRQFIEIAVVPSV